MGAAKKKVEMKTLLDTTRSRNIEIFLPSFSIPLDTLESKLAEQLNNLKDSELGIDHVVALKRYVCTDGRITNLVVEALQDGMLSR